MRYTQLYVNFKGRVKLKRLPLFSPSLSNQIFPPWSSMSFLLIAKPSPVPEYVREYLESICSNSLKSQADH